MVEVIGFNGAFQLATDLIGKSGIPEPPTPPKKALGNDGPVRG
jgi:hypothetical protein